MIRGEFIPYSGIDGLDFGDGCIEIIKDIDFQYGSPENIKTKKINKGQKFRLEVG